MKKMFEEPTLDMQMFETEDVLSASSENETPAW